MTTYNLVGGDQYFQNSCCLDIQNTEATGSSVTAVTVMMDTTLMHQTDYEPTAMKQNSL
jgi:hypothetical protein